MPIIIKDYTWEESESHIFITVPLKGVKAHKVDVFSTEDYLKVSFPPYLFECFLYGPVQDEKSAAEIGNGTVVFKLRKEENGLWNLLQHPDIDDKQKLQQRRLAAVERGQKRTEEREKERQDKKREQQSYAVKEQMRIENEERQRIEDEKLAEIKKASDELEQWKEEQRRQAEEEKVRLEKEHQEKQRQREEEYLERKERLQTGKQENQANNRTASKRKNRKKNMFEEEASGNSLRETGRIGVSFTERVFPTAARESTAQEEEEWLKKQAESRRIHELEDTDLSEEEKNPVWLRGKGNEFFKAGNYQAAVNAFTHAIRLNYQMPSLYNNRAAAHLKLRNLFKCIEDCERALELLKPPVPQNATNRVRAHVRRGTAFCELEMYAEGLMDYEAALKIDPKNSKLQADADRIRKEIQGQPVN